MSIAILINEKNMHNNIKLTFLDFALFKLFSVDITMMIMEVKCISIMNDEAKSKQAGCSRIKILFQYDHFGKIEKIKKRTNFSLY